MNLNIALKMVQAGKKVYYKTKYQELVLIDNELHVKNTSTGYIMRVRSKNGLINIRRNKLFEGV